MKLSLTILTSCLLLCAQAFAVAAEKPNVLLIIADDLRLQLSCYGDKHIHTPNIDALAASGTLFRTAYIAQSSCSPSRASIYTGLFPHTHGHLGLAKPQNPPLREEYRNQTLPVLMKAAGYRTAIIGKLHVNPKSVFPFDLNLNAKVGPAGAREVSAMAEAAGQLRSWTARTVPPPLEGRDEAGPRQRGLRLLG
ncbi:MAG TPA: sulfatase-like hydrolase/transferase [Planctomycetota bacterium]|jgi:N-sulfoglucosamine sulfohydrolase